MSDPRELATLARTDAEELAYLETVADEMHAVFFFAWCHHRGMRDRANRGSGFADPALRAAYDGLCALQVQGLRRRGAAARETA